MLADKDLRDSKKVGFEKFKIYYNMGIEKKENFDNLNTLIERSKYREENSSILDFLFEEYFKQEEDLLKYRILKLANWFLYKRQDFKYYLTFKEKIFELLLFKNGNVRHNTTHLVNDLRSHLLMSCDVDLFYYKDINYTFSEDEKNLMSKFQDLLISSFFELISMYEKVEDEKIKKNILKSIEHYYCYTMDEIIEGTFKERVDIYNKYSEIIFGRDEFEEISNEEFEKYLEFLKNKKKGFIFDYESCDDVNKLKEHIKELRDMIVELIEDNDDLELYIAQLEGKV